MNLQIRCGLQWEKSRSDSWIKEKSAGGEVPAFFTLLYNTDKYHHIPHSSDGSRLEQFPEDGSRCAHTDVWHEYWILRLH